MNHDARGSAGLCLAVLCQLMAGAAQAAPLNDPLADVSAVAAYTDESTGTYHTVQQGDRGITEVQASASTDGQWASATASLAGGLLRISGSATPVTPEHPAEQFHRTSSLAQATASLYDNLIIDVDDVVAPGGLGVIMPWSFTIDGSASGYEGVHFGYRFGDDGWEWVQFNGGDLVLDGSFTLRAGQTVIPFGVSIQGGTGYDSESPYATGGSFDLSHTVRVHFNAPEHVHVTSTSGLFPIGTVSPVPEPVPALLLGAGSLLLMARRRAAGDASAARRRPEADHDGLSPSARDRQAKAAAG